MTKTSLQKHSNNFGHGGALLPIGNDLSPLIHSKNPKTYSIVLRFMSDF